MHTLGWLLIATALEVTYRLRDGRSIDAPIALALGFGIFVATPIVYALIRRYEEMDP
ncbi:MAG: hypothetical protein ACOX87_07405 [Chloroflexota bacterium]